MAALEKYSQKRKFDITPEPAPEVKHHADRPLSFVIQKHAARRLHYDFRLELDGVLKSWAVPKGPSLNPADKRLAVMVEDHPIDYGEFEGVIPKGEYGAGQVIIWDSGIYAPDEDGPVDFNDRETAEEQMREGLKKGKLSFTLQGQKLHGSWTLVKSRRAPNDWLLIKHKDQFVDTEHDVLARDASVATGQTIADLKDEPPASPAAPTASPMPDASHVEGARRGPLPKSLSPMLPSLTEKPFSNPDWLFEPKLDGVRVLATVADGEAHLMSRRGLSVSSQYPVIAAELSRRFPGPVILDGEIVALDEAGRPNFHLLAHRIHLANPADVRRAETQIPVTYFVFDLLYLGEYDLRATPLELRKELLKQLVTPSPRINVLDHFAGVGEIAYEAALDHGLEGIVGKLRRSPYETGKRTRTWLKVKGTKSDEFVVGGYSEGAGNRSETFGALLVGNYDEEGKLRYAANVGTGFDHRLLSEVLGRLEALRTDDCPFVEKPPVKGAVTWVKPEIVVEVKFAERTPDGSLRAPVFQGIREDKAPAEARVPETVPPPPPPPDDNASPRKRMRKPSAAGTAKSAATEPAEILSAVEIDRILAQLDDKRQNIILDVQGERISLTHLDKRLWPDATGGPLTKRDFIRYLATMSPHLLRHLRDRPLTLIRFPNGVGGQRFFQKHAEDRPAFVEMTRFFSKHNAGDQDYLLCQNLPTLMWLGQMAALELHSSYSRVNPGPDALGTPSSAEGSREEYAASILNYPDFIVFDIDPYIYSGNEKPGEEPELNEIAFRKTCETGLWIKEVLDGLNLRAFVKTTGRTGLHIFVPIVRSFPYEAVRATSETIAMHVLRQHPKDVTTEWQVSKRPGKVFIDYNQGARGKTLASIYSPRAAPDGNVSVPLNWDELGTVYPTNFTIRTAPDRVARIGDLWADIMEAKHDLKAMLTKNGG